jgi:hypothetical protein
MIHYDELVFASPNGDIRLSNAVFFARKTETYGWRWKVAAAILVACGFLFLYMQYNGSYFYEYFFKDYYRNRLSDDFMRLSIPILPYFCISIGFWVLFFSSCMRKKNLGITVSSEGMLIASDVLSPDWIPWSKIEGMFLSLDDRFGSHVYLELSSDVDLNFSRIVYKRFKELFSEDSGRGDVIIPSSLLDDDFSDFWSVLQEYRSLSGDLEH